MLTIYLLRNVIVNGEPHAAGDVVTAPDPDALYLLHGGRARMATDEDLRTARNPQPAADARRQSQAVKGGPRPERRG
jgi:hypothetical protein